MAVDFAGDIAAVNEISAVSTILDVVCRSTGMGFAAVARVTEDRWIACQLIDKINFGLKPGDELSIETTLCQRVRDDRRAIVIDDVAHDDGYAKHAIPALYGFQSYISMPIILPDRSVFGTLCAIDPRPARLSNPETIGMFKLFADLIGFHLQARDQLARSAASLTYEKANAELRDQFIAVLGHDLRNPLASIDAGARMLSTGALDEKSLAILRLMQSSVSRMGSLIDDILDFARGRLGGGLTLDRDAGRPLEPILTQVVNELRSVSPDAIIETDFDVSSPVSGDHARIGQLLSNLIGNALTHGAKDRPVKVGAVKRAGTLELWVSNAGDPVPLVVRKQLFEPFYRVQARPNTQGLGLGLYIASEIAKAHGGTLSITSDAEETRFTFRMPLAAD